MKQERVQKQSGRREEAHTEESNAGVSNSEVSEQADKVVAEIDDVLADQGDEELLSAIDDVLEENAEQFVNNFVQQGGQ